MYTFLPPSPVPFPFKCLFGLVRVHSPTSTFVVMSLVPSLDVDDTAVEEHGSGDVVDGNTILSLTSSAVDSETTSVEFIGLTVGMSRVR